MANISELNSPYLTVIMMWHSSVNKTTHNAGVKCLEIINKHASCASNQRSLTKNKQAHDHSIVFIEKGDKHWVCYKIIILGKDCVH